MLAKKMMFFPDITMLQKFKVDNIVRITCDCPLVDTLLINKMLKKFNREKLDYLSNVFPTTFPDGFDIEIFNFKTLKKTFYLAKKNMIENMLPHL